MMGIQMALNVVLNLDKQIVHTLASEPNIVMQAGVPISRQDCQVAVEYKYGMMISSPGGHPKFINVCQALKGLAHAA
jgi:nickel-dependent lactate racemase